MMTFKSAFIAGILTKNRMQVHPEEKKTLTVRGMFAAQLV